MCMGPQSTRRELCGVAARSLRRPSMAMVWAIIAVFVPSFGPGLHGWAVDSEDGALCEAIQCCVAEATKCTEAIDRASHQDHHHDATHCSTCQSLAAVRDTAVDADTFLCFHSNFVEQAIPRQGFRAAPDVDLTGASPRAPPMLTLPT